MAVNFKTKNDNGPRINEQITASEVRLISSSGKQMGILSIREALIQAEDEGFDLVEVSPEANPPVCKIIDYGKLKYREQKSKKEAKKKQKTIEVKEIKMRPGIDTHDYNVIVKPIYGKVHWKINGEDFIADPKENPNSVIVIPAYTEHQVVSSKEPKLSLTINLTA